MKGLFGMYRGICTNNNDPEGLFRVKAICPQALASTTAETDWAWPCVPPQPVGAYSGGQQGVITTQITTPQPAQGVWLAFEGGDTDYPIWMGVWK